LILLVFLRSWFTVAYSLRIIYLALWVTPNFKFLPFFNIKQIFAIHKSVIFSSIACIFVGRGLSWLFSFETKFFIPKLLSLEINFICFFIIFGVITFFLVNKIKPSFFLLHITYLTPILQKLPESFFSFSKKLYHFSDLAWLEKSSYFEVSNQSIRSSVFLYKILREKPLIKQILIICFFLLLLIWL
jgi:hypothetical protein